MEPPPVSTAAASTEEGDGGLSGLIGAYGTDDEDDAGSKEQTPDSDDPAHHAGIDTASRAGALASVASSNPSQERRGGHIDAYSALQDADELDYEL